MYYSKNTIISSLNQKEETPQSLYQDEIIKLDDNQLQLRYILGGLYPHGNLNCNKFWGCDVRCSTLPVPEDEKFRKVQNFITKHNISNSTFLKLARSYLFSTFKSYQEE